MDNIDIWDQLFATLRDNKDYIESVEAIRDLEPNYLAVLESLTDTQKELIEAYISACDMQSDSMILHAYRLGYGKGRQNPLIIRP